MDGMSGINELMLLRYQGWTWLLSGTLGFISLFALLKVLGEKLFDDSLPTVLKPLLANSGWKGLEFLTIVGISEESPDVKRFRLQREGGKPFPPFKPGQFLSFNLPSESGFIQRSYSINSSPFNLKTLDVSVKKIPKGLGSGWFHSVKPQDKVETYPPAGYFTTHKVGQEELGVMVLIAGGIGITPMVSMVRDHYERVETRPLYLFYAVQTEKDLAFGNELTEIARIHPNFHYIPVVERPLDSWKGFKGFLNLEIMKQYDFEIGKGNYFFCGPPGMTKALTGALAKEGVLEKQIHSEKFISPTLLNLDSMVEVKASIKVSGETFSYQGKESILNFLNQKEAGVPFACQSGVCGTCKVRLISGKVSQLTTDGLTEEEISDGWILSCVARPDSPDLEIGI